MKVDDVDQNTSTASNDCVPRIKDELGVIEGRENPSAAESSDSDEWEDGDNDSCMDVESDIENIQVVSLFDDTVFNNVPSMLAYVRSSYNFDLAAIQKRLGRYGMDFLYNFTFLLIS
jgi:hypothetical protein